MSSVIEIESGSEDEETPPKQVGAVQNVIAPDHAIHSSELPFLVTHWLSNYNRKRPAESDSKIDSSSDDPIRRIHNAASELASAFASLGAFGTASRPLVGDNTLDTSPHLGASLQAKNASYSDILRQWPSLSPNHLETILISGATNAVSAQTSAQHNTNSVCLIDKAYEDKFRPTKGGTGGQRLGTTGSTFHEENIVPAIPSAMQSPLLLANCTNKGNIGSKGGKYQQINSRHSTGVDEHKFVGVPVQSDCHRACKLSSSGTRKLLLLREKINKEENEIHSLTKSITIQESNKVAALKERNDFLSRKTDSTSSVPDSPVTRKAADEASNHIMAKLEEIEAKERNCERVIAQLKLKLGALTGSRQKRREELSLATVEAKSLYKEAILLRKKFRDPFERKVPSSLPVPLGLYNSAGKNQILHNLTARQYGGAGSRQQSLSSARRLLGRIPSLKTTSDSRKDILCNRLSHSLTTNSHLSYPIYCLQFDRTGKYFVTGADDFLAKLFYLGAGQSCDVNKGDDGRQRFKCNYGANGRGAVLVCTLRGHTGVICDIDVSIDNAMLATASEDGDCRVWGLRDGAPVAILRGHNDGANMVSWSSLSPYRIVTISSDGLARMWDVREAALKRYGSQVGKRLDYSLPLTEAEKNEEETKSPVEEDICENATLEAASLPPLPQRETATQNFDAAATSQEGQAEQEVVVPPLPPGVRPLGGGTAIVQAQNRSEGEFVANDLIDEGVRLIAKLQHGDANEANEQGPSTRARRKAIKVLCLSRCPIGGHFATGTEDGLVRIWADDEEDGLDIIDKRFAQDEKGLCNGNTMGVRQKSRRSTRATALKAHIFNADAPSTSSLLTTLQGHVNGITDLHYSNAGDRLLTASQKDGVVRIWSWASESGAGEHSSVGFNGNQFADMKQILIRLTDPSTPNTPASSQTQSSRRRVATSASSRSTELNVRCDVAVWTHEDSKIVTSQSNLKQATGNEIIPGSQYLLVWDSQSGQCLIGISGAHSMACSVVVPHPFDATILCSAGGDGLVHLWDLDSGKCVFTHENKVEFGPVEQNNKGRKSGYLDGSFSPDGFTLVLSDDCGRSTIFDSIRHTSPVNFWMKEQYFANDFYELFYDEHGYCIEKGSRQPPHLAPRAVRCNHTGVPYPERVNDAFLNLVGPLPLPEQKVRWEREATRSRGIAIRRPGGPLLRNVRDKRTISMGVFDPVNTSMIQGVNCHLQGHTDVEDTEHRITATPSSSRVGQANTSRSANQRAMSSNWRYLGYDDLLREENQNASDDDMETDDEDFAVSNRPSTGDVSSGDDELDEDLLDDDESFTDRSQRNRRRRGNTSRRRQQQRSPRSQQSSRRSRTSQQAITSFERPSRVSARQQHRVGAQYEVPDSDDEFIEEVMSTNNTPSGPHVEDYNVHFFRMPENAVIKGKWLQRLESKSSYNMTKDYVPQVGDSVVYIPRAHYETIQNFPTIDAPWKQWPRNSAWPVVRCCIRDVRYRFPFEAYYRRHNRYVGTCTSVVAILTLEITGIPEIGDRWFPWPKPYFVSRQTRSSTLTFEVSLFENEFADFIIPEDMYLWRIETLEAGIAERNFNETGLPVTVYFEPDQRMEEEDAEMEAYEAKIIRKTDVIERQTDLHTRGSGFNSLAVKYDNNDSNESYLVSPWELLVQNSEGTGPSPPSMNAQTKKAVINALNKIECQPDVKEWFSQPVDVNRYSDYLNRVEVPMDYGFIRSRVNTGYYSNKLSVLSDARLIKENCRKYNGEGDLSQKASEIYQEFEAEINKIEEPPPSPRARRIESSEQYRVGEGQGNTPTHHSTRSTRYRSSLERINDTSNDNDMILDEGEDEAPTRRSSRGRTLNQSTTNRRARSSLESLPPPRSTNSRSLNGETLPPSNRSTRNSGPGRSARMTENDDSGRRPTRTTNRGVTRNREAAALNNDRPASTRRPTRNVRRRNVQQDASDDASSEDDLREDDGQSRNSDDSSSQHDESRRSDDDDGDDDAGNSSGASSVESENYEDNDDDDAESSFDEDAKPSRRRGVRTSRTRTVPQRRSSPRQRATATAGSSRAASRRAKAYDSPEEEEDTDESGRQRRSSRRSSPRSTRAKINMKVPSEEEDEFEEPWSEDNDSEEDVEENMSSSSEEVVSRRTSRGSSKRRKGASRPKSSRNATKKSKVSNEERALPELPSWPNIDVKAITNVAKGVLEQLAVMDEDSMFAIPVSEAYPYIADAYNKVIDQPMDFRTILEEKLPIYQSISELQDDLILVFNNCVTYNNDTPDIRDYAVSIWESINDVFRNVCKELDVLLPRRW